MRYEVIAAYVLGATLPILETVRRGIDHWLENATTMADDYLAGGLLLLAAWSTTAGKKYASILLVVAWAYISGVMFSSFWGQLEHAFRGVEWETNNSTVIAVKGIIWTVCVSSLVLAFIKCTKAVNTNA